jgi:hypothetical protein
VGRGARAGYGPPLIHTYIHTLSTTEGHPLLTSRLINTHSRQEMTVFSVGSVPRAQSEELKEYMGIQGS